jgi:hypothetical protein
MSRINVANFRHPDGTDDNITLDSSGRVGVGTTSPISKVHIQRSAVANAPSRDNALYLENNANCEITMVGNPANDCQIRFGTSSNSFKGALEYQLDVDALLAYINGSERLRIDSSGRLLVGTSNARSKFFNSSDYSGLLQIEGRTDSTRVISFVYNTSGPQQPLFVLGKSRGTAAGSNTVVQNNDNLGTISFQGADGTELVEAARISCEVDATPGANDMPGRLTFSTTADGASNAVERMRIVKDGHIYIGRTNDSATAAGTSLYADGFARHNRDSNTVMILNRGGNDGSIINFQHAGTTEGSISVSGTTVSYNGAHLSRWSQLPGGVERTEILRGSVLSNIDEMCDQSYSLKGVAADL